MPLKARGSGNYASPCIICVPMKLRPGAVRTSSQMLRVDGAVNCDAASTVTSTHQTRVVLFASRTHHSVTAYLLHRNIHAPACQSLVQQVNSSRCENFKTALNLLTDSKYCLHVTLLPSIQFKLFK